MYKKTVLLCCIFVASLHSVESLTLTPEQKAKIHEHFEELGIACISNNAITEDDIKNLRSRKMPTGENAPCFLACIFKKLGVMDDAGMLQKETALDIARKVFNDEDELKLIGDYLHSCSHINSEPVRDGEKGCERAIKAYQCMMDNASQFGLEL